MKMKKWITLALSAALCFTLLSSCSRPSTSGGSSPAPSSSQSGGSETTSDPIVIKSAIRLVYPVYPRLERVDRRIHGEKALAALRWRSIPTELAIPPTGRRRQLGTCDGV